MDVELLKPKECDRILRYPFGKTAKLVKAGKIPYVRLPDGNIRIRADDMEAMLKTTGVTDSCGKKSKEKS